VKRLVCPEAWQLQQCGWKERVASLKQIGSSAAASNTVKQIAVNLDCLRSELASCSAAAHWLLLQLLHIVKLEFLHTGTHAHTNIHTVKQQLKNNIEGIEI
jgi:hypothetical protein